MGSHFDVVRLLIDVDIVPIFVAVPVLDAVNIANLDVVLLLDDVDGLFEPDVVA